jgi:2-methylcitrate dehydratase PrpD
VVILPALLALAERERLSGAALLCGIATGYHLMGALGIAARIGLTNRRFRPLGISGPFGAAAGAIAATCTDEETAVHALAFAANFGAGLNQWPRAGGQEIYVHAGMAARNGLVALDLARAGLTASADILEGEDGLFAALGSATTATSIFLRRLDGPNCLMDVTHKPVPGCNFVQTAAAAALQLHAQLGAQGTRAIRRIVISTFSAARNYPGCNSVGPFSRLEQSKMSFQYAICAALRHGRLDNTIYSYYDDAELQRLIGLTELRIDPRFEQRILPAQPARVEVEMAHGERLASELADVPWFDAEAVHGRFLATAQPALGDEDTRRLVKLVDTLWNQDDTSEFFSLMQKTG